MSTTTDIVWTGRPSQWVFLHHHIAHFIGIICLAVLIENLRQSAPSSPWLYHNFFAVREAIWWAMGGLFGLSVYRVLAIALWRYELTQDRLIERKGVTPFTRTVEVLELYTVTDYSLPPPGLLALFARGSIRLVTRDPTSPTFVIRGIPKRQHVYENLRASVERVRLAKKGYFQ